ncbi:hypothetical protein OSTOST_05853, partial [Ostertagia ostertagi]
MSTKRKDKDRGASGPSVAAAVGRLQVSWPRHIWPKRRQLCHRELFGSRSPRRLPDDLLVADHHPHHVLQSFARAKYSDDLLVADHHPHHVLQSFARAKYSGLRVSSGRVFDVDRHFVRRRRRAAATVKRRVAGVRGVARDCGVACHLRLRSDDVVYIVHLQRWRQLAVPINKSLPVVENEDVVPLVQYFDSDSSAKARLSHAASDCIYRARVADTEDTSIVNLCDSDNGL